MSSIVTYTLDTCTCPMTSTGWTPDKERMRRLTIERLIHAHALMKYPHHLRYQIMGEVMQEGRVLVTRTVDNSNNKRMT